MCAHDPVIASLVFLGASILPGNASAQGVPPVESARVADVSSGVVVLDGFVLDPSGAPAEGAVVVSSAGGRAVTDAAGSYRLELELPLDARTVQVTATQRSGQWRATASAQIRLHFTGGPNLAGVLTLSPTGTCQPSWVPTFGMFGGLDGPTHDMVVFDDGNGGGPALFVAGSFSNAGGVPASRIAKWDGVSWSPLGSGMNGSVVALAVHDDGSGPALYVGGSFTSAGGVVANRIAKWDGTSWSPLGSGMSGDTATVYELTVFDDGSGAGPALYAGGTFTSAGGVAANRVAKWDGVSWSPLGSGFSPAVLDLIVFDDGTGGGPALHAGGLGVSKWDGTSWLLVGDSGGFFVHALEVFDDGSGGGLALYAGGTFTSMGGTAANNIAKWNGTSWSPLGSGMNGYVFALAVHDDGSGGGPVLFAGGEFFTAGGAAANRLARWAGASWAPVGSGTNLDVTTLAVFDDGSGPALYVGGRFTGAGGGAANYIANWNGTYWRALGRGLNGGVSALTVFDDGGGSELHAGGCFNSAGRPNRVARWDGTNWSPLGGGVNGCVLSLTVFDPGSGPALYAGGAFTSAGGVSANRVARWDGTSWSPLGSGVNLTVFALTVFDDGSGPALYAGGGFTSAGGVSANSVARWDGTSWSPLGSGVNLTVFALTVFDDGSGPALYAGGHFTTASGLAANRIARWDGTSWSPLGSGMNGSVVALAVHDDGAGPALFAGGSFSSALDSADSYIARWGCPLVPEQCVLGKGYWKTHGCDWPAPFGPGTPDPTDADRNGVPDNLEGQCGVQGNNPGSQCPCDAFNAISIGSVPYDQCDLLCSLDQPVHGNALRILARHLIAAKLNVLNGASDAGVLMASCAGLPPNPYDGYTVAELIAAGDSLIATGTTDGIHAFVCAGSATCPCPRFPANILTDCVRTSASGGNTLGPAITAVAQLLDLYSNGCGGVPHCPPAQLLPTEHKVLKR